MQSKSAPIFLAAAPHPRPRQQIYCPETSFCLQNHLILIISQFNCTQDLKCHTLFKPRSGAPRFNDPQNPLAETPDGGTGGGGGSGGRGAATPTAGTRCHCPPAVSAGSLIPLGSPPGSDLHAVLYRKWWPPGHAAPRGILCTHVGFPGTAALFPCTLRPGRTHRPGWALQPAVPHRTLRRSPAATMSRAPGKHKVPREPKEPKAARETYDVSRRCAGLCRTASPVTVSCARWRPSDPRSASPCICAARGMQRLRLPRLQLIPQRRFWQVRRPSGCL